MGHIICPWNIMWHNMTPGHLYVKVNISAWQFDKSGQGSCQCGFILAAEKEVLWHRVVMKCVCGTLCVCVELVFTNLIPIDTSHLVWPEKVLSGLLSCLFFFPIESMDRLLITELHKNSFLWVCTQACVCFTCTWHAFNMKKDHRQRVLIMQVRF